MGLQHLGGGTMCGNAVTTMSPISREKEAAPPEASHHSSNTAFICS